MCGCGDPAPRQAPGAAARPIKTFTTESLGAINKNFAGMSTADDHFEPGFPGAGPDRQNERFGRPERQERHRHRRDQPREYMLQMEADKATYLTAQSQLERNKRLIERQAISRQDYETAEAAYVRARTAYDNSKSILADTKLVAPFSGAVEKVYADNYQRVQAGRAGYPACQSADAFGQVHDARKRTANPQIVRPRVYRPVRQLSERRIRCPPQRVCPELDAGCRHYRRADARRAERREVRHRARHGLHGQPEGGHPGSARP